MTALVVDASVVVKWFVEEEHSDHALKVRDASVPLIAPDILMLEFATAMSRLARQSLLTETTAILNLLGVHKLFA